MSIREGSHLVREKARWKDLERRKLNERRPYGIIYRIVGEEILIVALAHTSRKPGYWKGR